MEAALVATALRSGDFVSDAQFDRLYPSDQRVRSMFHWTPVDVALRACALLAPRPWMRILDVGAGVGKVCLIGALTTRAIWVGAELDATMIAAARAAATRLGVDERASFVHCDALDLSWSRFDAVYFFNPFVERLLGRAMDAQPRRQEFFTCVERASLRLLDLRPGAIVVTYHGVGCDMPAAFELVHREDARDDRLCVWIKQRDAL